MAAGASQLGKDAIKTKGWLKAHKWLLLRRISQFGFLLLFLLGPWFGVWIVQGSLMSSMTLDVLPLTDPYLLLQTLVAGHIPETIAITGALIVIVFYLIVGGRSYCSWVCPVNVITDTAEWLRYRLGIKNAQTLSRRTRYMVLLMTLILAAVTGTLVWELVNPVTMVQRALVFGMGYAWMIVLGVFIFDLLVSRRGWCGHLCPVGAFYSVLGTYSLVRVSAADRDKCDDCMECFAICPEPQVITPALKGAGKNIGPIIRDSNCTNCGRCIDICSKHVFRFDHRFNVNVAQRHLPTLSRKVGEGEPPAVPGGG
jgi:ferredoxin-type protein NapH